MLSRAGKYRATEQGTKSFVKVEIFYFQGCPNHEAAVRRVREILQEERVSADIVETEVLDPVIAQRVRFLGSPTIQIDGRDVEPDARESEAYAIVCRTYRDGGAPSGMPSEAMIRAAVKEAAIQTDKKSASSFFIMAGSVFAAILASFCCILPIVFGLTGLSVLGASAAFAAWRPYLLAVTFGLLAGGFYFAYRPVKSECAPGTSCATPSSQRSGRMALWLTAAMAGALALFPSYSGRVAELVIPDRATHAASSAAAIRHASFGIEGMDCAACAKAIEGKLKTVAGVRTARVSYERKAAEVDYDPAVASLLQLRSAIEEAGYRAAKANTGG